MIPLFFNEIVVMVFFLLLVYVYAELITLVALVDVNSIQTPMKLNLKVKLF